MKSVIERVGGATECETENTYDSLDTAAESFPLILDRLNVFDWLKVQGSDFTFILFANETLLSL